MKYLKKDKLESRAYQEVIAASATTQDTMVVIPTGLGKTVIAAMVAAQKAEHGKVMFLAPTKPLVQQHKREFNNLLDIPKDQLKVLTGDTRPNQREKEWKNNQIFFATPQIVENDLISDIIPVEEFSLIIFDEAHRATGNYSYTFINEKIPDTHRLALTASPGGDKEQILKVADNLNIDNFEVRTEEDPDVEPYIQEKEVNWEKVQLTSQFEKAKEHLEKAHRKQLKKLKNKGFIDKTNNVHKKQLLNLRGKLTQKISQEDDPKNYQAISHVATSLKITQAIELLETQGVTPAYEYINGLETDQSKAAKRALNNHDVQKAKEIITYLKKEEREHPKIEKLMELLMEMNENQKAIVFTEYRDTAQLIKEEVNLTQHSATKFIGQQGEEGMSQKDQIETIEKFDQGEHNVLVSTSIGEEGLDIPAVDQVIFYEPVPSGIRDIQRMGRTGRQTKGKVTVLIAENTRDEANYWSAHHKKKRMNQTLQELKNEAQKIQEEQKQKTLDKKYSKNQEKEEKKEEDKIEIIADDRENSIAKELSKKEIKIDKKRLDVADFVVSEETAIERKRTDDFVDSLIDQRLFEQIQELQQYNNPIIIIEGENLYTHRDIEPDAIRGTLSSIATDYQIPILWTEDKQETVKQLQNLAKREQKEKDKDIQVRATKNTQTQKETQKYIVAGLPNINTKTAEKLLNEFQNVQKIFTASKKELKQVEGIGDKKSEQIREIITKNYNN